MRYQLRQTKFMKFIHVFRCDDLLIISKQMIRIMKVFVIIMVTFLMQVSASTNAQQLTIKAENISFKEIFMQIRKQTGYTVLAKSSLIKNQSRLI